MRSLPLLVYGTAVRSDTSQESGLEAFRKTSHIKSGGAHASKIFRDFKRMRIESLDRHTRPSQHKRYVYIPSVYSLEPT